MLEVKSNWREAFAEQTNCELLLLVIIGVSLKAITIVSDAGVSQFEFAVTVML